MTYNNTKNKIMLVILVPFTGFVSCILAYLFVHGVLFAGEWLHQAGPYYLLLPLGFYGSYLVTANCKHGSGIPNEKIMDMLHRSRGNVPLNTLAYRLGAFALTVLTGGSVGKAGPSAQIGAGISNGILRWKPKFFSPIQREILILCGISGGFTAVFGAPLFASVFANKIIWSNRDTYKRLLPSLIAAFSGFEGLRVLGLGYPSIKPLNPPALDWHLFVKLLFFSIFIAIMAFIFIALVSSVEAVFQKWVLKPIHKALLGGILLIILVLWSGTTDMLGIGQDFLYNALNGEVVNRPESFFKMFATSLTFASGGKGGILSPIFIIGSAAGSMFSQITDFTFGIFPQLGMLGFFAATTNAPLAGLALSLELFGIESLIPGAIVIFVSYNLVRRFSVFSSQAKKLYYKVDNIWSKTR